MKLFGEKFSTIFHYGIIVGLFGLFVFVPYLWLRRVFTGKRMNEH